MHGGIYRCTGIYFFKSAPILFFVTVQPLHLLVFIFMKTRSLVVPQIRHSGLPHCLRPSTCHNLLSDIRLACAKVSLLIFSHLQNLPPVTLYRYMATQKTAGSHAFCMILQSFLHS